VTLFHVFVVERDETAVVARGEYGGAVVMNTKYFFSNLFIGALFLGIFVWGAGCAHTVGSGIEGTSRRPVEPFSQLIVSGHMVVNLEIGDENKVSISGDDNLVSRVKVVNDRGTLRIQAPKGTIQKRDLEVTVITHQLSGIVASLTENAIINVSGKSLDAIDVRLSGVGNLVVNELNATSIRAQMDGTGILRVSGSARKLDFRMSGLGTADFERLCTHTADVKVHGMGKVVVTVDEFLDATIRGLGRISYVGDPSLYRDVKGGGKVEARDDRITADCGNENGR
jgi:hypothetical protein